MARRSASAISLPSAASYSTGRSSRRWQDGLRQTNPPIPQVSTFRGVLGSGKAAPRVWAYKPFPHTSQGKAQGDTLRRHLKWRLCASIPQPHIAARSTHANDFVALFEESSHTAGPPSRHLDRNQLKTAKPLALAAHFQCRCWTASSLHGHRSAAQALDAAGFAIAVMEATIRYGLPQWRPPQFIPSSLD